MCIWECSIQNLCCREESKHSGLRHVTLHNVTVGDNCCIENIQNYIANYEIGHDTFIENVDIILVDGEPKFGSGVEVSVLNRDRRP